MAKMKPVKIKRLEALKLSDLLIKINGQLTIPDPERIKEVQNLYYSHQITKSEVNFFLNAPYN